MAIRKQLDKVKEARRRARNVKIEGTHQRVIQDKRRKPEKHKKPFGQEE
jgi:hypothetical protein